MFVAGKVHDYSLIFFCERSEVCWVGSSFWGTLRKNICSCNEIPVQKNEK